MAGDVSSAEETTSYPFMGTVSDDAFGALKSAQKGFIISMRVIPLEITVVSVPECVAELCPLLQYSERRTMTCEWCGSSCESFGTQEVPS